MKAYMSRCFVAFLLTICTGLLLVTLCMTIQNNVTTHLPSPTPTSHKTNVDTRPVVNPHPYDYLINPGDYTCRRLNSSNEIQLLMVVISSPTNYDARQLVRSMWGDVSAFGHKTRVVFMLGLANETVNSMLREESARYGDIVQETFFDSYRNLTLKTVMMLRWASIYCPQAQLVLKVTCHIAIRLQAFLYQTPMLKAL